MDHNKVTEFFPGDKVRFIFSGNRNKTGELEKENIRFSVLKVYKHYILCRAENGYNECFNRDELRRA